MKKLVLLAVTALLSGCATYTHERTTNGVERTQVSLFLVKGEASKIRSATKDGDYSRTLSIGALQGQGDVEMLKTAIESTAAAVGKVAGSGAKAAVVP